MIHQSTMGCLLCGTPVDKYRLTNASGAYVEISTLGGCLLSMHVPDREGILSDVLLGFDSVDAMLRDKSYMGYLIGRFGNRIGGATFSLNGQTYTLAANDGENHLHGGNAGFDKKVWEADQNGEELVLRLHSPDGDEGYPGALSVRVTYAFSDDNALRIRYEATCDQDTVINLTNHAYFNLSGPSCPDLSSHEIQIDADSFTEVSSPACIPTGRLLPVDNTPLDLRSPRNIAKGLEEGAEDVQMRYGNGYDHNFVIRGWDGALRRAAIVEDVASGRKMEVYTDQPGIQFYSGNLIAGDTAGKCGVPYAPRQGFCLETQHFPDSIHQPNFPSCVLKKGETYKTVTEYRFLVK